MVKVYLLLFAVYTSPVFSQSSTTAGSVCCPLQIVTGRGDLDGQYSLVESQSDKPEEICLDGCIYARGTGSPEDKYCFKLADGSGESECMAPLPDTKEELNSELNTLSTGIEEDEKEIETLTEQEDETTELTNQLGDVNEKVDALTGDATSSPNDGRVKRQAAQNCQEISSLLDELTDASLDNLDEATKVKTKLAISKRIVESTVTQCSKADITVMVAKKTNLRIHYKKQLKENNERVTKLRRKKKERQQKLKEKQDRVKQINIKITDNWSTPDPSMEGLGSEAPAPTGERPVDATIPTGERPIPVTIPTGEKPIPVTIPTGEKPIPVTIPTGERPIPVTIPTGEKPILVTIPTGEKPIPVTIPTGERPIGVTIPTGEKPLPVTVPTGEKPLPVTVPTGEKPLPVTVPTGEKPLPVTVPTGEKPLPVTGPTGEKPLPVTVPAGEKPLPVTVPTGERPLSVSPSPGPTGEGSDRPVSVTGPTGSGSGQGLERPISVVRPTGEGSGTVSAAI